MTTDGHTDRLAIAMVLGALLASPEPAAAQWSEWRELACAEAALDAGAVGKCSARDWAPPNRYPRRTAIYETVLVATREGVQVDLHLREGGRLRGYGEGESEARMKNHVTQRLPADVSWSTVWTERTASYLPFTADGRSCLALDMSDSTEGMFYRYLVRGFICLPSQIATGFDAFRPFLSAIRILTPPENTNALGRKGVTPWPAGAK